MSIMKEVTIFIPDERVHFILELLSQLGVEVSQKYDIPEEHMNLVRDRIAKSDLNPDLIEDWDIAKKKLKLGS
ncbi:MAG: hypothetical protein IPN60_06980 [Saprospiraceae bacterium]|nr:hypothetical protein [Candidatus Opimibacter skivensis]MBL0008700.1 hypothetical protein [Candidatus Opimibacter skivensis]